MFEWWKSDQLTISKYCKSIILQSPDTPETPNQRQQEPHSKVPRQLYSIIEEKYSSTRKWKISWKRYFSNPVKKMRNVCRANWSIFLSRLDIFQSGGVVTVTVATLSVFSNHLFSSSSTFLYLSICSPLECFSTMNPTLYS